MTLKELENYRCVCAEIISCEEELRTLRVGDSVQSARSFPFALHTVHIEGFSPKGSTILKLAHLAELRRKKAAVEDFIYSLDGQERYILEQKFMRGKSYQYIAMRLGYADESTVRKKAAAIVKQSQEAANST